MSVLDMRSFLPAAKLTRFEARILEETIEAGKLRSDVTKYAAFGSRHIRRRENSQAVGSLVTDLSTIGAGAPAGQWAVRRDGFVYAPDGVASIALENVEATLQGVGPHSTEIVIVSAHLDSTTEEPGYQPLVDPAPGADDDATGIAGVLGAARAVVALLSGPALPRRQIRFVLFNAEEVRQQGSRIYAARLAAASPRPVVKSVYHMDMIGFKGNMRLEYELHAGYTEDPAVEIKSLEIARLLESIAIEVSANLIPQVHHTQQTGSTPADPGQNFSDHTSFHKEGFPACLVTENFFDDGMGPGEPNPDYHLFDDTIANLDFEYAARIARAVAAAAWYMATR